jgi:hypothetical protein
MARSYATAPVAHVPVTSCAADPERSCERGKTAARDGPAWGFEWRCGGAPPAACAGGAASVEPVAAMAATASAVGSSRR